MHAQCLKSILNISLYVQCVVSGEKNKVRYIALIINCKYWGLAYVAFVSNIIKIFGVVELKIKENTDDRLFANVSKKTLH